METLHRMARARSVSPPSLRTVLWEDLRRQDGNWTRPGFQALAVHRLQGRVSLRRMGGGRSSPLLAVLMAVLETVRDLLIRNLYGIELHYGTHVGRRLLIAHQHGITVHHFASIGDDCAIHQNVTIGRGARVRRGAPHIGDRVEISPGAVLLGAIKIGDDAKIGPNAIVMTDVPPGSHVVAAPGRILRLSSSAADG